tara:strand:- start:1667 stop:2050 length:384 start_codon:yes stop_codon:yes gene_type:complete
MPSGTAGEEKTDEYTDRGANDAGAVQNIQDVLGDVYDAVEDLDAHLFSAIQDIRLQISVLDNDIPRTLSLPIDVFQMRLNQQIGNLTAAIVGEERRLQRQGQGGRGIKKRKSKKTKGKSKKTKSRKR